MLFRALLTTTLLVSITSGTESTVKYVLCKNGHDQYHLVNHSFYCNHALVEMNYGNGINNTGWAYVEVIVKDANLQPLKQAYLMGFIEGHATQSLIDLYLRNMVYNYCDGISDYCPKLYGFLEANYAYYLEQIANNKEDPYWEQVEMSLHQLLGLIDGFDGVIHQNLTAKQIVHHPVYLAHLFGDLEDLEPKFEKPDNRAVSRGNGHCSALIKHIPSFEDILVSHVTWTSYASMLRVQKKYSFALDIPGREYSFSGYPGVMTSIDDFVITSARLTVLETTIENHNKRLFKKIRPQSVLYFIRSTIAHRVAETGREWAETFKRENSGTYNNQWMIIDYKLFKKGGKHLTKGLFHVLEQMPRFTVYRDMTLHLQKHRFWSSFNRPYFMDIFELSDGPRMVRTYGDWYSHDNCPRALIFKRDQHTVVDEESMTKLMRSNNYLTDEYSRCSCDPPYSAESAISARSELNPINGTYPIKDLGFLDQGATDIKITSSKWAKSLQFSAIAGPVHGPTPVFDWSTSILRDTVPHHGQPIRWEFQRVLHKWHR